MSHAGNRLSRSNIVDILHFLSCSMQPKQINLTGIATVEKVVASNNIPLSIFGTVAKQKFKHDVNKDVKNDWKTFETFMKNKFDKI